MAFASRFNLFTKPGGDTVQFVKTRKYLTEKFGLNIDVCLDAKCLKKSKAEIVHIFNLQNVNQTVNFVNAVKGLKKVVLSPIFWDLSDSINIGMLFRIGIKRPIDNNFSKFTLIKLADVYNKIVTGIDNYGGLAHKKKNKYVIDNVDLILPNSPEELGIISRYCGSKLNSLLMKTEIIPNAVDVEKIIESKIEVPTKYELPTSDFVMQASRIVPDKNQLSVIKALEREEDIPLVFVGENRNRYGNYLKEISSKRGNVFFLGNIPHDDLFMLYKQAKVHVMPSFRDSPGLSSLEALLSGTEIVVSEYPFCPVDYYKFDKYAHTCNPYDIASIKKSIMDAFANPLNNHQSSLEELRSLFNYENVAKMTIDAYYKHLT